MADTIPRHPIRVVSRRTGIAVDTLRAAAAHGFADVGKLDRERAFALLRTDPEFKRLTDELRRARPPE